MRAFWVGAAASPSTSATNYHFLTAVTQGSWGTGESVRCLPMSDDVRIKRFKVWVQTAPGAGKSYSFTIRNTTAATDTAATVTISDTNVEAAWSGDFNVTQLTRLSIKSVPVGTPAATARVYWSIEYETLGNFYLIPGSPGRSQNTDADLMMSPFGGSNITPQGTNVTRDEAVIPTGLTVIKIAAYSNGGSGNTYRVRKNGTIDSTFTVSNGGGTAVSTTGALGFAAGDTMLIRQNDSGASWTQHMFCITVVPDVPGEIVTAFTSPAAPSTTAIEYEGVNGLADNDWDPVEANVYMKFPACVLKKLYVKMTTAPGSGKSRQFTVRSNMVDTGLTCTVSNTALTSSDIVNSVTHDEGNFLSVKMTPSGTPAASNGAKFSFVFDVPQTGNFFPLFN